MRQAILLEPDDLDALRDGIGIHLALSNGETLTLMFASRAIIATSNGRAASPRRAPVRLDKRGRVITRAARASMLRNAAHARKALAAKRRREAATNGN